LAEVRLPEGEALENALRRFNRNVPREDVVKEIQRHSFSLKPGEERVTSALARERSRKKVHKEQD
jgi:ribosomal protein S21